MIDAESLRSAFLSVSSALPSRVPISTYRLQFNRGFRLRDTLSIIPYLHELGITDIYSSPYFKAREGSLHGYDIIDHQAINPEIGDEKDFSAVSAELNNRGMGLIMDIVPNHMSIASTRNMWWQDVLENGPSSPYAHFFDIDWKPAAGVLEGKVLLPILGGQYGEVLERQELTLTFAEGAFFVNYYEHRLPLDPCTYVSVLDHARETLESTLGGESPHFEEYLSIITALGHLPGPFEEDAGKRTERHREKEIIKKRIAALHEESAEFRRVMAAAVKTFNGQPGRPESLDLLDGLLAVQVYRLSFWQVATEEINYRRFFDINDLAAIRTEDPEVFRETHRMVLRHIAQGKITGLRVDHPDGLYSPHEYFQRLQEECFIRLMFTQLDVEEDEERVEAVRVLYRSARKEHPLLAQPFYIIGEKILMENERIPEDWPIHGTTGYGFMNLVNGLFVSGENRKPLTGIYTRFSENRSPYPELVYERKRLIMKSSMAGEINVLGHGLDRISESDRHFRDFTLNSLVDALGEVIAFFPVYRTYTDPAGVRDRDRRYIESAISRARRHSRDITEPVFEFIRNVLTLTWPENADARTRAQWLGFTMNFQQLTGPVMAKGLEDTVFYDYNRLISLNEVGGNPDRFGVSLAAFHGQNIEGARSWPHALVATSTHDAKRSEDVRARINVLSEIPLIWRERLMSWGRMNNRFKKRINGHRAPSRNDEYLLYQTLLGSWPLPGTPDAGAGKYTERIKQYMRKAVKEAKKNTSWVNPNAEYEEALEGFIEGILGSSRFLEDFLPFQGWMSFFGMMNSLAQTLLKITSPGVPDFYQGTEFWSLTLVDPDNRRKVNYGAVRDALKELREQEKEAGALIVAGELLEDMTSGRIKLYMTHKALHHRRKNPHLYLDGDYSPLYAEGLHGERAVAFERKHEGSSVIPVAPRFLTGMVRDGEQPLGEVWEDTRLVLGPEHEGAVYRDVFTGLERRPLSRKGSIVIPLDTVFSDFPFALLERVS
jgi:(1->4)-alpha-D-glucan 1-alpha-D-glucosylmutase